MSSNPQIKSYSWDDLNLLASQICEDIKESGYAPECIIGILRGGCFPGLLLSHKLGIRSFITVNISTTDNEDVRSTRHVPKVDAFLDNRNTLKGNKILLVDDVVNTGKTIEECRKYFYGIGVLEVKTACLVRDIYSDGTEDNSRYSVDYFGETIPYWAKFPWEN